MIGDSDKYQVSDETIGGKNNEIEVGIQTSQEKLNDGLDNVKGKIGLVERQVVVVDDRPEPLENIDTDKLHELILSTERWQGFMLNMGYELNQMRKMLTMCEDATIKVRRLVHNFEEKMQLVE